MRKVGLNFVVLLLGIVLLEVPVYGLLYDFEDEAQMDDWEVTDGQGRIENGTFVLEGGAEGKAFVGDVNWTDYTITCKATMTGGTNNYGIIYRYQDNVNYYMNAIKFSDQQVTWAGRIAGTYLQGQDGMRLPLESEMNKEYQLKLEVAGPDFKLYVDGELVHEFTNDEFETGAVGLRVYGSTAIFDDFEVNGPGIPKSGLAVDSTGKLSVVWGKVKCAD